MHSKIRDSFQSQHVSKIPEIITKSQSGILSTYFPKHIYAKQLIPFKASENSFYIPRSSKILHNQTFTADQKGKFLLFWIKRYGFKAFWAAKICLIYQQKCFKKCLYPFLLLNRIRKIGFVKKTPRLFIYLLVNP